MFKTKDNRLLDVEEFTWAQARILLLPLLPELVAIIDEISPGKEFKLYLAKYPYGVKIIDKAQSYLPLYGSHETVSFNDPQLPFALSKNLSYDSVTSNPVGIALKNSSEFHISVGSRVMPYAVVEPGSMFGLARIIDNIETSSANFAHLSFFRWELTSGARSLILLPNVSETIHHNRLKKYSGSEREKPKDCQEHFYVCRDLAHTKKHPWRSELLFLSNNWFEKLKDPAWSSLYCYFLRNDRSAYAFWRNILSWNISFNLIEQMYNLRYSSYALDMTRHLFAVTVGGLPGFVPLNDNRLGPINFFQESYVNGYGLKNIWPTIMGPAHFSATKNESVYCSLTYPTLAQCDPNAFTGRSLITLIDQIQHIEKKYTVGLQTDELARSTSLAMAPQMAEFLYYHSNPGHYSNIKPNILLPTEDERFLYGGKGEFAKQNSFLRSCVKISPRQKNG